MFIFLWGTCAVRLYLNLFSKFLSSNYRYRRLERWFLWFVFWWSSNFSRLFICTPEWGCSALCATPQYPGIFRNSWLLAFSIHDFFARAAVSTILLELATLITGFFHFFHCFDGKCTILIQQLLHGFLTLTITSVRNARATLILLPCSINSTPARRSINTHQRSIYADGAQENPPNRSAP